MPPKGKGKKTAKKTAPRVSRGYTPEDGPYPRVQSLKVSSAEAKEDLSNLYRGSIPFFAVLMILFALSVLALVGKNLYTDGIQGEDIMIEIILLVAAIALAVGAVYFLREYTLDGDRLSFLGFSWGRFKRRVFENGVYAGFVTFLQVMAVGVFAAIFNTAKYAMGTTLDTSTKYMYMYPSMSSAQRLLGVQSGDSMPAIANATALITTALQNNSSCEKPTMDANGKYTCSAGCQTAMAFFPENTSKWYKSGKGRFTRAENGVSYTCIPTKKTLVKAAMSLKSPDNVLAARTVLTRLSTNEDNATYEQILQTALYQGILQDSTKTTWADFGKEQGGVLLMTAIGGVTLGFYSYLYTTMRYSSIVGTCNNDQTCIDSYMALAGDLPTAAIEKALKGNIGYIMMALLLTQTIPF